MNELLQEWNRRTVQMNRDTSVMLALIAFAAGILAGTIHWFIFLVIPIAFAGWILSGMLASSGVLLGNVQTMAEANKECEDLNRTLDKTINFVRNTGKKAKEMTNGRNSGDNVHAE